ncbi:membrane-anchored mycosin MYCP [Nocardioides thalensis]|uniref:Membrane-anchored mycosin MYCP n=1 Tax=Nocardioides thalensis TaxID=1914755 RepID=A0A853BWR1_9ACTN|nr:S8 family serine peptidase [Nocardioides thalensis]NYI99410.1 membrane-anchored mycosin MYCP [Nocardioides thalensis]
MAGLAVTGVVALSVPPVHAAPPAALAENPDCAGVDAESPREEVIADNLPYEALQVRAAHELLEREGRAPGAGVTVVVVDTGVRADLVDDQEVLRGTGEIPSPRGTVVAGIAAGADDGDLPIGVAPGADVVSLKVHDIGYAADPDEELVEPSADAVASGLEWVRSRRSSLGDRIVVVVPLAVDRTPALASAVRGLDAAGVLVVAPGGDRSEPDAGSPLDGFAGEEGIPPGENAVGEAWPAGFRSVLAVGASPLGADASSSVAVQNSDVDVAAPTYGGVSYGLNGSPCVVMTVSTEYAAAYVAGVAALVWSGRPADDADELRDRLVRTADGGTDPSAVSRATGHGVVQPVEALQRRTLPADGARRDEVARRAEPPGAREDLLASTRRDAVWWGLAGGTALVVALLLRPVLARRRR